MADVLPDTPQPPAAQQDGNLPSADPTAATEAEPEAILQEAAAVATMPPEPVPAEPVAPEPAAAEQVAPEPAAPEPVAAEQVAAETSAPEAAVPAPAEPFVPQPEPVPALIEAQAEVAVVEAPQAPLIAAEPLPELESSTSVVPLAASAEGSEGGEWNLLLAKLRDWLAGGHLQSLWEQARSPLTLVLLAAALLLVLRIYTALLGLIDSVPLAPGLLELLGLIWAVKEGLPRLVQRSRREQLFAAVKQRWQSFRGQG
jgi:hypothetical protein